MTSQHEVQKTSTITDDELKVIEFMAAGLGDKAIARRLGVSVVTVRRRAASFRRKVGARTRPEAVAIAVGKGWIAHRPSNG